MPAKSKTTIATLRTWKREGRRFAVLTCYDYSTARLLEESGMDAILVGDTYGEVCLGHATTLPVTMDQIITVTQAVRRGAPSALLIGDMPFMSYQADEADAVRNAGRFLAEAGCDCVKVEVDRRFAGLVASMSRASIPVMAHLGLRPQSIHQIGGYRAQGKTADSAMRIIEDAKILADAGAVALLLEAVPSALAKLITESTDLPVVGCVSGPFCNGQVVVMHDILGYHAGHPPRSVRQYARLHDVLVSAFREYAEDVRSARFPEEATSPGMDDKEWEGLQRKLKSQNVMGDSANGLSS